MKKLITHYLNHPTSKNIGYLTLGNIISQIVSLIGAIYIPNLLGPEKYGTYNTVIAFVGIFGVFTFSGLNKVVIRESSKDLNNAKEIIESSIGLRNLCSFLAVFICLLVVLFVDYDKGTKIYILVYSFSLFLTGFENIVNSIYQSFEKMKVIAILSVIKSICMVFLTIIFLSMGYGILSLILINLVISLFILIINIHLSKSILSFNLFSKIRLVKTYIKSGINFTILDFLGILSGKIDLVMLSFLATPKEVGIYALAYRLVEKGLFIRSSISQSLFPLYSKKFDTNKFINKKNLYIHSLIIFIPSIFVCVITFLFSRIIIVNLIGSEFIESSIILNILVLYLVFNYSIIPYGLFLQTIRKENLSVIINIVTAILNVTLNYIFYIKFGIIGIAYSTLIVEASRLILAIYFSNKIIIHYEKQ